MVIFIKLKKWNGYFHHTSLLATDTHLKIKLGGEEERILRSYKAGFEKWKQKRDTEKEGDR